MRRREAIENQNLIEEEEDWNTENCDEQKWVLKDRWRNTSEAVLTYETENANHDGVPFTLSLFPILPPLVSFGFNTCASDWRH